VLTSETIASEPDYGLRRDKSHACAVPWGGTWDLAARCDGLFSAAAPVSGGGDPLRAESLARLPLCVVHGAQDMVVPVERSLEMVRAVRRHGGAVREVVYSDAGHGDAVERAYAPGSELYDWIAAVLAGRG
jgi:predicted peptidase